jgi:hypothetical protein
LKRSLKQAEQEQFLNKKQPIDGLDKTSHKSSTCGLTTTVSIQAGDVNESAVESCGHCVFLGNTRNLDEEELRNEIARLFGPLDAVEVIRDRANGGQSRGYAFATFQDVAHARACVRAGYFFVGDCLLRSKPADRDPSKTGDGDGGDGDGAKVFLGGTGRLSQDDLRAALEPFGEVIARPHAITSALGPPNRAKRSVIIWRCNDSDGRAEAPSLQMWM